MIKEYFDDHVLLECPQCGKSFKAEIPKEQDGSPVNIKEIVEKTYPDNFDGDAIVEFKFNLARVMKSALENQICDDCVAINQQRVREQDARDALQSRLNQAASLLDEVGIPRNMRGITKPPCRNLANFLWKNQTQNILLVGTTGIGKTTSACACLERMRILKNIPVKYVSLSSLVMKLNAVSRFNSKETPLAFMDNLDTYDVVCIDEAFEKTRLNDMTSEMLYTMIDSVTSGAYRCKLWLLGNLRKNSIQNVFADYEPVMRRFEQFFVRCSINQDGTVVQLNMNELL